MKEKITIRYFILIYWTFFGGLTIIDKIIPDVYPYWVGADFYTLFIKFFASLGLTDPIFATIALAGISSIEVFAFVCYLFSLYNLYKGKDITSEQWFFRGIFFYILLFSFFSIGDQVFGDRNQLLEHGIFWLILIVSWTVYKYNNQAEERTMNFHFSRDVKIAFLAGIFLTGITSYSILNFSQDTYSNKNLPVQGEEVVQGVYKFDFPFLADKKVWEKTLNAFEEKHPELKINYTYTGPDELNSKKKTHMLLYLFTEKKNTEH
jgi:hypothetical protein